MKHKELQNAIREEWQNLHHNASIARYYPDFQNDYENSMFWDVLGGYVVELCNDLSDGIHEDYGIRLKFYSYGRNGATIAPDEWMDRAACGSFGTLKWSVLSDFGGLEAYNEDRRILKILKHINKYWHDTAKEIGEWWRDCKEANNWQADINEHDGMTQHTITVWR